MNYLVEHIPAPSCHRTLRRPFNRRGVWNFPVPRPAETVRQQHRAAIEREAQRMMTHARWCARKVYQHVQFEALEVNALGPRMTMERKRPQQDAWFLLADGAWLAAEFRKLGVHEVLVPYATRILKGMCGQVPQQAE